MSDQEQKLSSDDEANGAENSTAAFEQAMEQLRGDLDDAKERLLRAQAEAENTRKRLRRELDDERRYAALPILGDLLPVVDNVERTVEAAAKVAGAAAVVDGFKMVAQQLSDVLARHHCQRIDALHQPFDPNKHAAIAQQPSAEYPPNTVLLVAQQGYQVHERVLRPAQVIVSRAPDA
ncbi:MAG: nucleotide exchange factor GrpE [Planctomycetes bacterium]|nr:nucleotide exchange factor GrpE [Planctomycetota bacterium]